MRNIVCLTFLLSFCMSFSALAQNITANSDTSQIKEDESVSNISSEATVVSHKNIDVEKLKEKSDLGDIDALLDLGYIYLYGVDGNNIDYKLALQYYEQAAEKKNPVALNNLGSLYFNGIGAEIDEKKAIELFEEAVKLGNHEAAVSLATIYLNKDIKNKEKVYSEKAIKLLEQAQTDNYIAKFILAYAYEKNFVVKTDFKKAFSLLKESADKGLDEAQLEIALCYIEGRGTPRSYKHAVEYLNKSAYQGNVEAMMKLADILSEGKIYNKDLTEAYRLYNIATLYNIDEATTKRDELEKDFDIENLLKIQASAENFKEEPSEITSFSRQSYGRKLKDFIDLNLNNIEKE